MSNLDHKNDDRIFGVSRVLSVQILIVFAIIIMASRPLLPDALVRVPAWAILPWDVWLSNFFNFVKDDIGLIYFTRTLTAGLEWLLDITANLLVGKRRWPHLGPIPWTAIAAVAAIIGYWLGGWKMSLLAGGTFVWTALIGQWKIAMQTLAVLAVAAPVAFFIGLFLGILAWKYGWFDKAIRPVLSVLQTLPFFTYLLPAVIFFKVGPTAGAVATIVYAIPPMILMTTVGLKKVSNDVVEAGKMSGASNWQMLRYVYLPAARTEILVGVNQVIMLCLAMVVLTAFIGMPGLGAKLLLMMNSFKLGRSFEIGVTIVLLAIMLDRCTKVWVIKQPEHFVKGTPWFKQNAFLLCGLGAFFIFLVVAQFVQVADHITRKQDFSMGKEIDVLIKSFLDLDPIQATTNWLRWFLNVWVLIPFRNSLLWFNICRGI